MPSSPIQFSASFSGGSLKELILVTSSGLFSPCDFFKGSHALSSVDILLVHVRVHAVPLTALVVGDVPWQVLQPVLCSIPPYGKA